jgi:hypothetical protein
LLSFNETRTRHIDRPTGTDSKPDLHAEPTTRVARARTVAAGRCDRESHRAPTALMKMKNIDVLTYQHSNLIHILSVAVCRTSVAAQLRMAARLNFSAPVVVVRGQQATAG